MGWCSDGRGELAFDGGIVALLTAVTLILACGGNADTPNTAAAGGDTTPPERDSGPSSKDASSRPPEDAGCQARCEDARAPECPATNAPRGCPCTQREDCEFECVAELVVAPADEARCAAIERGVRTAIATPPGCHCVLSSSGQTPSITCWEGLK